MSAGENRQAGARGVGASAREELMRRRLMGGRDSVGEQGAATGRGRKAIGRADRERPLPLSFGQQQMWFLNRLDPDSAEYLVPLAVRLRGSLDRAALRDAWSQMTVRHEILRTRYIMDGAAPVQVIDAARSVDLADVDLSDVDEDGREQRAAEVFRAESAAAFDLEREWPLRGTLVRLTGDDHVLIVAFHHIACDAWSTRLFLTELSDLYQALVGGRPSALAEPDLQYGDFAVWQREHMSGERLERELSYWRDRLVGLAPLELPTDRPRPTVRSFEGAEVTVPFPAGLDDRLKKTAAQYGVTPFVVLLTAYQLMLSRHAGRSDVAVGTVVSGRGRPELQTMLGYGINSLVMRAQWGGGESFGQLLKANRETVFGAYDHQGVPFARLVDELESERDMSRTPLYQVSFTMHESAEAMDGLFGLESIPFGVVGGVAKTDLELQVAEAGDGSLSARLAYPVALFDRGTVERMAEHWLRLLSAVVANPSAPVAQLEMLNAAEKTLLTVGPRTSAPVERCVHEVFEERVAATPDAVAVVADGVELSYAEVNARANRLARYLGGLGVGPESLVGVCLERGVDLIPTLLGVLKSGAGYVPLDPVNPAERLGYVASDASVSLVVTQSGLLSLVDGFYDGTVLVLDGADRDGIATCEASNPSVVVSPDSTVYVIYTSGSTGRPKGVNLEHANVVRLLAVSQEHYAFDESDVFSLFHSYAFDVSVFEMWGALMHGGRLAVVPREMAQSPDDFLDLLVRERVTVLSQTPSAFRSLVGAAADGDPRIDRLSLRAVIFAGEKLEVAELQPWVDRIGLEKTALVNMYGITETTVHSTYYRLEKKDFAADAGNPIGYPLSDLAIYLLDQLGNIAPVGITGEMYVGGPGVARGYLGRAALTAERFIPNPFGTPGSRLYRSGDLARRREDGSLEFLGRIDGQVKIRGYRIELGEIESVLSAHSAIRDGVVVVREDTPGDKRLVAYYVPAPGAIVGLAALRAELGRGLPEYMVPTAFVELEALPLTANGKLDKRALPAPEQDAFARGEYVAPCTPLEERIAAVWSEVLGVERVGVEDSFFDLGGDSIRAVALVGALRTAGFDTAVRDVFAARTVTALAELLDGQGAIEESAALTSVERFALISVEDRAKLPTGVVDAYPLSRTQTGMVVEMLADTSRNHYHNVSTYRIRDGKPFSHEAFAEAGRIVVARHETLRTSIDLSTYSVPMQLVHAAAEQVMGVADLGNLAVEEQHEKLREFTAAERTKAFDFAEPPLMRYFAHTTEENGWWISVTECHPIMEGWSYHSLLMELLGCYMRLRDGLEPEPYDTPEVRYADFIAGELESLASDEDRAYWTGIVTDYAKFSLPAGWNDSADVLQRTHQIPVPWHDLENRLRALSRAANASFKSVMLAAHLKVMSMLTDEEAFHTGLVFDARPEALGADRVYGMYLNTLPFPADRASHTWRSLVERTFAREVELWGHRRFPMPEIQREASSGRLIDVFFNYQDFRQVDTGLIDPLGGIDDSPTELPLTVSSRGGYIILTVGIPALSKECGERIAGMYRSVLEAMAADFDGDARAVYLPEGERERHLENAGGAAAAPVERCVHEVFEERVAATPDAVAVVADGVELSYAEVNARANRLARYLGGLGVGPESLVGVCLERGVDLIPTLLGVLKSGAGYVPLDPVNPAERLGYVASDAGVSVVVTHSELRSVVDGFHDGRVVVLDGIDADGIAACKPSNPGVAVSPSNTVYVIYTSGSTGRPKGVNLEHANVVRLLAATQEHYAFDESDAFSLFHSYAFDVSVFEMWGALFHGGRLIVVPREMAQAPDEFLDLLVRERVTVLSQTPSAFRSLVGAAADGDFRIGRLGLRAVIFAGEKLEVGELGPWVDRLGLEKTALVNMYGITETTVHSTYHRITTVDFAAEAGNPIGRPLSDLSIHPLDSYGNLVPVGVPGEMYVGGPGVARGYLGRPALTAERFVPDPFGPAGSRLYRSGDLARRREDGSLEFLGRIDDQVKIRGYRVELGEIESALSGHSAVRDGVVVVREDTPGDKRLVAYYVPAPGATVGLAALRAELGRALPEYMVPAAFVGLEALPLTANGKLDKRALPAPEQEAFVRSVYVAPRTLVEMGVASVWSQVLGVERVGVEDSFFDLGGDSIRAVALVGALRAIGFDATIQQVFQCRTIAALCEAVAGTKAPERAEAAVRGVEPFALITDEDRTRLPEDIVDAYPLSQVQTGMVVEMLADTDRNTYHGSASHWVRDDKPFSADALRKAAAVVAERNEVLRMSFDFSSYSLPLQLVHARAEIPVAVHDLRHLDDAARHQALYDLVVEDRDTVFDLQTAPQLRFTVFLEREGGWRLGVTQNHAITEGWSNESLLMELIGCYMRLCEGLEPEPYDAPDVRYADFIAGELESLASDEDRTYWRGIVADYVPFALPSGWEGTTEGAGEEYALDVSSADLESGLRTLAAAANASFKSVLLAAHLKVMSMLTDEPAFHTGLVCDARPEVSGADRVYGMYLNTLPVPVDRGARTWRELVERTFAREVELWGHRRFPMPEIQREASGGRLIDSLFNYQNFHHVDTEKVDTSGSFGNGVTEFALSITASPSKVGLQANTRDLARAHGQRIVGMYRSVLEAMAADVDGDARASFLPEGERQLVLGEWQGESREVADGCLAGLVEAQVARTPDAVAVVSEDAELTYAALNARANRLARRLRAAGVTADSVVGLCLERSAELVV
ncbi:MULTISPECIES: amino acid adenylation domain-containing protein, partial [unclassified Streptomyces]